MKNKLAFIILVLLILFSGLTSIGQIQLGEEDKLNYANPKKYEIGGITVTGVKYLDNSVLVMLSGLSVGDIISIPGEEISRAINNLWEQGLFENVKIMATRIENNVIFLNIDLSERPRMSSFTFNGIKKSEADNIRDEIKLASGDVVTDNLLIRTKNKIQNYYTDKGYLDAIIKIDQEADSLRVNHVRLVIDIKKNERVKIKTINIYGNTTYDNQKVKKSLKETKEKGSFKPFYRLEDLIFSIVKNTVTFQFANMIEDTRNYINENIRARIFKSSKYIKEKYDEDLVNLIKKYNENGQRFNIQKSG